MSNVIRIKRSSTPGAVPLTSDLEVGELAVNLNDRKLFTKNNLNTIVELGGGGGGGAELWIGPSNNPPPTTDYFWWNNETGRLYIFYNDGDSGQWVDASPAVQGEQGEKGDKGDTGEKGDAGEKGQKGDIGTLPWVVANTNFTANTDLRYLIDTRLSPVTVTLGTPTTNGVSFVARDYGSYWDINNVTVNAHPNQVVSLIGESNTSVIFDVADVEVSLIWNGTEWRLF